MILEWQQMAVKVYTDGKIHSKIQSGLRLTNFLWQVDLYCSNPQTNLNIPDYPDTITVHTNDTEKALYFGGIYRKAQSTTSIGGKPYWIHAVRIGTLVAFGKHLQKYDNHFLVSYISIFLVQNTWLITNTSSLTFEIVGGFKTPGTLQLPKGELIYYDSNREYTNITATINGG